MDDFLGNNISDALEDEFDLDDPNKAGKNMLIIEPTSIDSMKNQISEVSEKDGIEDYIIARKSLQETLDQSKEILKTASELLKDNPNPAIIKVIPNLINSINNTANNLFNIHVKISNEVKKCKNLDEENKEDNSDGLITTKEFLNTIKNRDK